VSLPNVPAIHKPAPPTPTATMAERGERPWVWKVMPRSFLIMHGRIIPRLVKVSLESGVNGCIRHPRTGLPDLRLVREDMRDRGEIEIPFDIDGEGTSYLVACPGGGWRSRWWKGTWLDEQGYAEWAESLITRGVCPPPGMAELWSMLDRYEQTRSKVNTLQVGAPDKVRWLDTHIAIVKAAIDKLAAEEPEPEPAVPAIGPDGSATPKPRKPRRPTTPAIMVDPIEDDEPPKAA
jgi:hypothetical protein